MFLVKISFLLDIHVDTFNYDRFNSNLIRNIDNFRTEPITLTKYFCKNMQNDINVKKKIIEILRTNARKITEDTLVFRWWLRRWRPRASDDNAAENRSHFIKIPRRSPRVSLASLVYKTRVIEETKGTAIMPLAITAA